MKYANFLRIVCKLLNRKRIRPIRRSIKDDTPKKHARESPVAYITTPPGPCNMRPAAVCVPELKLIFFCCCSLRGKEEKSHPARRATQNQDREALLALPFRRMELVFRLGTSFRVPIWMNHGYSWVSEHWWFLVRYTHTHTKRRVISLPK